MKIYFSFLLVFSMLISGFAQEIDSQWTLEACVNYALQNNLSVKQSEYNYQLQEIEVERAKNQFLPSVSGSSGLGYNFGSPRSNDILSNSFGISASSILYNGNRNRYAVESACNELDISQLNIDVLKNDLAIQVVNAYLNVLYNRESVKLSQEQVSISEKLLERMNELVNAGVSARNDLYQAEANLASNEERQVTAQNNLDASLLNLAQLLQLPFDNFDIADVVIDVEQAENLKYSSSEMIYQKALEWRPEIVNANKRIENSDLLIKTAESGKLPVISASYGFGLNYAYDLQTEIEQKGYFDQLKDSRGHNLGVSLSIPIFDQFNTKINTQRANIQRSIAETNLENEKVNLRTAIERAYLDAKTSLKTLEAAKKTVQAQKEAFRTAEERYNLGVMTSYDFEQVRNQLVQAQSSYINAKYNYLFKTKFLEIYYGLPVTLD